MIDLFNVYICPECGERLSDEVYPCEPIGCNGDRFLLCSKCNREARLKTIDGVPCYRKVDHERWLWAEGFYDESGDYDEEKEEWPE